MKIPQKSPILFFRLIFITSILPYLGIFPIIPDSLFGLKYTSLSWMGMFLICIPYLLSIKKNAFPVFIFIPYFVYIFLRTVITPSLDAFQFIIQPLTPILIGIIASSYTYTPPIIHRIYKISLNYFTFLLGIIILSLLFINDIPIRASAVMTLCIYGTIFLSIYLVFRKYFHLLLYLVIILIIVLAVMRTATLLILLIYPLHFLNNKIGQKTLSILGVVILGTVIFLTPSFQRKMFFSGEGSYLDLSVDNPNFNTSGRNTLKGFVEQDLREAPIFGKGPRKDVELYQYNNFKKAILHNDYLLLRHSYGYFGLLLYLGSIFVMFISVYRLKKRLKSTLEQILWGSALTIFIPYLGFMYTDNIYLYGPFFGHFHFALLGIIFSIGKFTQTSGFK